MTVRNWMRKSRGSLGALMLELRSGMRVLGLPPHFRTSACVADAEPAELVVQTFYPRIRGAMAPGAEVEELRTPVEESAS